MSNIVSVRGSRSGHDRALIVDRMTPGMTRYVTEDSIAIKGGQLFECAPTSQVKHDKFSVRVECIAPHRYAIAYEGNREGIVEPDFSISKVSNIVSINDVRDRNPARRIGDMVAGEVGYTVEWAVDDGKLNEDYNVRTKGNTSSLRVECVAPQQYRITYENPSLR